MNVLYFGSVQGSTCAQYYFTAMAKLGLTVLPFDPEYYRTGSFMGKVATKLLKGPTQAKQRHVAESLKQLCAKNQFDVVFVMAENFLHYCTINEIRKSNPKPPLFVYHSHDNNYSDGICKPKDFFETLASYDFAFTTKSQNVSRYQKDGQKRAHFIPSAFEPSVHRPIQPAESRFKEGHFEIGFVGTYDQSRIQPLAVLGWEHLHVWGSNWEKYPHFIQNRKRITPNPIYYLEFADVISHTQVSLGLLREEAEDRHTQRTFEIPACGSLQLCPRNDEILRFFREDQEIVCYETLDEMKDKAEFYLKHPKQRDAIAKAGLAKCLNGGHSYQDRVSTMFRIIEAFQSGETIEVAS